MNKDTIIKRQSDKLHFSLIELLVVAAIIGMLSSMLLAVLAKSRDSARRALCLSNEKQIGNALFMYADDNNNSYPTMTNDGSSSSRNISWDDYLSDYDGRNLTNADKTFFALSEGDTQQSAAKIYLCPSDLRGELITDGGTNYVVRSYSLTRGKLKSDEPNYGAGLVYRGVVSDPWSSDITESESLSFNEIKNPGNSIVLSEFHLGNNRLGAFNYAAITAWSIFNEQSNQDFWVHGLWKMNFLYADGHIEYRSYGSTYEGTGKDPWSQSNTRYTQWDCRK